MNTSKKPSLLSAILSVALCNVLSAAEIALVPVAASGSHTIVGNDITLQGGGQFVTLEIQISNWDPDMDGVPLLQSFQVSIDSAGYTSGLHGTLAPKLLSCPGGDIDCLTAFGGICSLTGTACVTNTDCQFPAFETCDGSTCSFPPGFTDFCEPAFINTTRPDYVFINVDDLPALDVSTPNFRYASTVINASASDPGLPQYAGTLILDVPLGAMGTFTIAPLPLPSTLLQGDNNLFILPLDLFSARISIACQTNADCNDGSVCTDDVCQANGTCSNTPNFDDTLFCCNPVTGNLATIDDGNECTDDVCDAATGSVGHTPVPMGTACGNPTNSECDNPDTCSAAGVCQSNVEPVGFACGDPTNTDCTNPDTCDGAGACLANDEPANTPCGDPTSNNCTAPDTCDAAGACLANNAADGTPCDDLLCCTVGESCTGGVCGGGTPRSCDDALPCTTDTCDETFAPNCCVNTIDPGQCVIDGVCRADGDVNPANDCQECNSSLSVSAWSFKPSGSTCDDGDACTGTGRPGIGVDTCDGTGICSGVPDPQCNDDCAFAIPVVEGANTGNNDNRGPDDAEASCQVDSNNDVWFVYTASCNGPVFVSTTGSQFLPSNDPVVSIYDACPSAGGTEIACDDDSGLDLQAALTFTATAGAGYWMRVAGFEQNTGDIVLNISTVQSCLIGGICFPQDSLNPANECEACLPDVSTTTWSPLLEGSPCGNPADTECDSPDACNGAGLCELNPKPDGTACTDDGNECTSDLCAAGACSHPPVPVNTPCGDPNNSECDNPDSCDGAGSCQPNFEPVGLACGDPSDSQCNHPDICTGAGLCNDNLEPNGTVCDDGDVCTGGDACDAGLCVGTPIPQAPIVEAPGPRYLVITPRPAGSPAPVALQVTSPMWPCLVKFVNASGLLVDTPVFRLTDDWGTIAVRGQDIVPSTPYAVEAQCGGFTSAAGVATTTLWGDLVGPPQNGVRTPPDGIIDVFDFGALIDAFKGLATAPPIPQVDLWPCVPDGIIDILDIVNDVDAFKGRPYPCPPPCS